MQRETCRLQPGTPRRTVHRLRATLLSHFPARPPARGGCGEVGGPAPALSLGAFPGPVKARWQPPAAPTHSHPSLSSTRALGYSHSRLGGASLPLSGPAQPPTRAISRGGGGGRRSSEREGFLDFHRLFLPLFLPALKALIMYPREMRNHCL